MLRGGQLLIYGGRNEHFVIKQRKEFKPADAREI